MQIYSVAECCSSTSRHFKINMAKHSFVVLVLTDLLFRNEALYGGLQL